MGEKLDPGLLYIDGSYTLAQLRARSLEHVLNVRKLDGRWPRVFSVHPIDNYLSYETDGAAFGPPDRVQLDPGHVFLRGRFGWRAWLQKATPLNFLVGQIALVRHLAKLVRHEKLQAVRAGDPLLCGLLGLAVAKLTGRPLMIRVNGNNDALRQATGKAIMPRLFRTEKVERFVERLVLSRADSVLVPSENYRQFALSKGADPTRCHEVRYGNLIDPRHTAPVEGRVPLDDPRLTERPFMLYIGRLEALKHSEDCLEVLSRLVAEGQDVALCYAGDGSQRLDLEARSVALGLGDRVHFLGNQTQDALSRMVPMCACILSPITGRALTEVAFGEASIVAYDLDWQKELVIDGASGLMVPARDVDAMVQAAHRILQDPALAAHLGKGARARAYEMLDPELQTELEIAAYDTMLKAKA